MKFYQYPRSTYRSKIHLSDEDEEIQDDDNETQDTDNWGGLIIVGCAILFALGFFIEFVL